MSRRCRIPSVVLAILALAAASPAALAVPSFSRQIGQPCSACHTQFPELNSAGRAFKLGGYTLTTQPTIDEKDKKGKEVLSLPAIPLVSVMLLTSYTEVSKNVPAVPPEGGSNSTQNGSVLFPDQMSLFLAGRIASRVGAFLQVTYDGQEGSVGWDNAELRFVGNKQGATTSWGFTLNNNPTVQDLWNSTPAWAYPWAASGVAPAPAAATLIEGSLAQNVAGVGGYFMWNDTIYGEATFYRSAPQGVARPLDGLNGASAVIQGLAPYWRLAYQRDKGSHSIEVGTFGIQTKLLPGGGAPLEGPTDRFTDWGLDAQYQLTRGEGGLSAHASWIREKRTFDASFPDAAANLSSTLNSAKIDALWRFGQRYAVSGGAFWLQGDSDPGLYPGATGSPDSNGYLARFDYMPWQNVKLSLLYTAYAKFDGSSSNYDGNGRNASDNNSVFASLWLAF